MDFLRRNRREFALRCLHVKEDVSVTVFQTSANWQVTHLVETLIKCIVQRKVIDFWRKCENFATFLPQFYTECINTMLHKTDFTSARLAAVKSWLQCAFILPLVFWHKLPSPSSELQLMTNFPIYTQAFKGYLHYCSIILRKFSLVTIWRCVGETASIFRGKKKPKKRNHLQSQMEGEPQIFATLLPLQPACGCTGHWHTAGCSLAWCLCGWFDTLCASNPDPEEPAGKSEKEVNQQTV